MAKILEIDINNIMQAIERDSLKSRYAMLKRENDVTYPISNETRVFKIITTLYFFGIKIYYGEQIIVVNG